MTWGPLQEGGALKMPVEMLGGLEDAGGKLEDLGGANGRQLQDEGLEVTATFGEGGEGAAEGERLLLLLELRTVGEALRGSRVDLGGRRGVSCREGGTWSLEDAGG